MCSDSQAGKPLRVLPAHYRSLFRNVTTVPNIMGHVRALLLIAMLYGHVEGLTSMVFVTYLLNLCVLDNLDGIVARRLGQCTSLGRVLDIGLDVCSESLLLACIYQSFMTMADVPLFMNTFSLWAVIVIDRCIYTVGCFAAVAITFAGFNWKDLHYPCPITRWYHGTNIGGYGLYCFYHGFLAAVYAFAHGQPMSLMLTLACMPGFILRLWASWVGTYECVRVLMDLDRENFLATK